jgi:enoyl-CoA hydratase/carnithine racemase
VYDRFETLLATRKGPILEVVLNRPDARNAITFKMEDEITELLNLATDDEVRVVTLRGAGKLFSAGHDLKGREHLVVRGGGLRAGPSLGGRGRRRRSTGDWTGAEVQPAQPARPSGTAPRNADTFPESDST